MPASDSTSRFSNRVADYVRYRPGYPDEVVSTLQAEAGLKQTSVVADIGAGTGISTELFLRLGCTVYGVEPNREMRAAAEDRFRDQPRFHSLNATAEATTLPAASVDFVTAGQAFHWFDVDRTRAEFFRILRPDGMVALFWNTRCTSTSPFLVGYEQLLLEFATDYQQVRHEQVDDTVLCRFFGGEDFCAARFPNSQSFNFDGLKGRLLSSSYAPAAGHPRHEPMLIALRSLFDQHAVAGGVRFEYDTELFFGPLHQTKGISS